MIYTAQKIAEILKAEYFATDFEAERSYSYILTDSRRLRDPKQTLFFALKSDRDDGARYIESLYKKEVRLFIIQEKIKFSNFPEASFILVNDSLKALQQLVQYHRSLFDIPIVGITGSNGKTIVKEWLFELLKKDKKIVRNPRSYNSQIGVPLSVWMLEKNTELGIFEAGISEAGEMSNLERIIQPNIGIFTNIGDAHQENFMDYKHKISEKIKLFSNTKTIIYCKDNQLIDLQFSNSPQFEDRILLTWSEKFSSDLRIKERVVKNGSTNIKALYQKNEIELLIPFVDFASYENIVHIWLLMLHLGYSQDLIQRRISRLSNIGMRLEQKQAINNCTIINDTYNSDIGSLNIALDLLSQQNQHPKKTLILSDILQTGRESLVLYKEVADLIESKNINLFIGIGHEISSMSKLFSKNSIFYDSTDVFLEEIKLEQFDNEAILIKGARVFEFERISNFLQNKNHQTVLEVDLSNLIHNVNYYRSLLKPKVKLMAMVKAFSYGAGSVEIANVLQYHKVDYLAVAYADEGVDLRKAGISLPIMVMNPQDMSLEQMIRYGLEPEIYSFGILKEYYKAVRKHGTVYAPLHLKIETGMNRLGFVESEIEALIEFVKSNPTLKIVSVFSHLAGSDDEKFDSFTEHQIQTFTRLSDKIINAFDYPIIRHINNSQGIQRHNQAQFDMVRLGIGMYGISVTDKKRLKEVNSLYTRISQIKKINPNDSVGYNRAGVLPNGGKIAIIPIGYADGIRRSLSNGKGQFMINGFLAPIVGNVCMDMCMLDVSNIECKEGDKVLIFGEDYPIKNISKQMNTIEYEVLTGISQRVKRIYFQE